MKKLLIVGLTTFTFALAGCQAPSQDIVAPAAVGGLGGAAIGAAVGGDLQGALIGGAIGAGAGALLGAATSRPGECVYRDGRGQRYVARCPDGYR
ncbi:glycine zipper domain-containing protein [Aureimonas fodinaquatilis]|uniref:glycine zipper domain-containing protein n=1 Tax=Aureimonas fodinaquatilis TaxID=2565783 RepID=UPI001FE6BBF0|nr:glycine zipper domain-containing protein [Aureimonas fodinaquatilis]